MKRFAVPGMHVAYWGLYFLLLIFYALVSWHTTHFTFHGFWRAIVISPLTVFTGLPAIVTFYLFYTVLFSRLLRHRRLVLLALIGIGVSLGSALLIFIWMSSLLFPGLKYGLNWDAGMEILVLGFIALVNGVLALVMRGFITWYGEIQLKEDLKRQNAELELALIKSQIS